MLEEFHEAEGGVDEALFKPPLVLGCERGPLIALVGAAALVTLAVFDLTPAGFVGGALLIVAGVIVLRRIAVDDPYWFAVVLASMRYPRDMPEVPPDPAFRRHIAFVGYEEAPNPRLVALARMIVVGIVVATGAAAGFLFGLVAGIAASAAAAAVLAAAIMRLAPD